MFAAAGRAPSPLVSGTHSPALPVPAAPVLPGPSAPPSAPVLTGTSASLAALSQAALPKGFDVNTRDAFVDSPLVGEGDRIPLGDVTARALIERVESSVLFAAAGRIPSPLASGAPSPALSVPAVPVLPGPSVPPSAPVLTGPSSSALSQAAPGARKKNTKRTQEDWFAVPPSSPMRPPASKKVDDRPSPKKKGGPTLQAMAPPSNGHTVSAGGNFAVGCTVELKPTANSARHDLPRNSRGRIVTLVDRKSAIVEWTLSTGVFQLNVSLSELYFCIEQREEEVGGGQG